MDNPKNSDVKSIGILTVLGVVNGVLGIAHSSVLAIYFGTSREAEVYFAAMTLIGIVGGISQSTQLADIFLPIYLKIKTEYGKSSAFGALSVLANWTSVGLIAICTVGWFLSLYLVKLVVPGFSTEDHILGMWFLRAFLPLLVIGAINNLLIVVLNAEEQFGKPESAISISYLLRISVIILFSKWLGAWVLVLSLLLWIFAQFTINSLLVLRIGYRHKIIFSQHGFDFKQFLKQIYVAAGSVGTTQIYAIVFSAMVSRLPQGVYAILKYVQQIYAGITAVLLTPINKVYYTAFSRRWIKDGQEIKHLLQTALDRMFGLISLANIVVIVASKYLIAAIWGGSRFSQGDINSAYLLLEAFFLLFYFEGAYKLLSNTVIAIGGVKSLYSYIGVARLSSTLVVWLVPVSLGINAVILVQSYYQLSLMIIPLLILRFRYSGMLTFYPWSSAARWFLAGSLGVLSGFQVDHYLQQIIIPASRIGLLSMGIVVGISGVFVALIGGWLLRIHELREITAKIARRR